MLIFLFFVVVYIVVHSISMIEKLPGSGLYDSFAYDIMVLKYFVRDGTGRKRQSDAKKRRSSRGSAMFGKIKHTIDSSLHSVSGRIRKASMDFSGHSWSSTKMRPSSMDGSNHSLNTKRGNNFPIMTPVNLT